MHYDVNDNYCTNSTHRTLSILIKLMIHVDFEHISVFSQILWGVDVKISTEQNDIIDKVGKFCVATGH